jgi:hypothetical protein
VSLPRGTQRATKILLQKIGIASRAEAGATQEGELCLTEIQVPEVLNAVRELMEGLTDAAWGG